MIILKIKLMLFVQKGWEYNINTDNKNCILIKQGNLFELLTQKVKVPGFKKKSINNYLFDSSDPKIIQILELYENCKFKNDLEYYENFSSDI